MYMRLKMNTQGKKELLSNVPHDSPCFFTPPPFLLLTQDARDPQPKRFLYARDIFGVTLVPFSNSVVWSDIKVPFDPKKWPMTQEVFACPGGGGTVNHFQWHNVREKWPILYWGGRRNFLALKIAVIVLFSPKIHEKHLLLPFFDTAWYFLIFSRFSYVRE